VVYVDEQEAAKASAQSLNVHVLFHEGSAASPTLTVARTACFECVPKAAKYLDLSYALFAREFILPEGQQMYLRRSAVDRSYVYLNSALGEVPPGSSSGAGGGSSGRSSAAASASDATAPLTLALNNEMRCQSRDMQPQRPDKRLPLLPTDNARRDRRWRWPLPTSSGGSSQQAAETKAGTTSAEKAREEVTELPAYVPLEYVHFACFVLAYQVAVR
jgi:hypothetical protein